MRLSQGVEWALHCCSVLAGVPPERTLPSARLAELHEVPPAYLAKHLQALSAAGIVESVPGPKGGYRLARSAEEITVLDVVLAVEGDQPAFVCTEIRQCGPGACPPSAYPKPAASPASCGRPRTRGGPHCASTPSPSCSTAPCDTVPRASSRRERHGSRRQSDER